MLTAGASCADSNPTLFAIIRATCLLPEYPAAEDRPDAAARSTFKPIGSVILPRILSESNQKQINKIDAGC